jgi:hypothetical protein
MMNEEYKIILFPAGENLSFKQKEFVLKKFNDISLTEIEYIAGRISEDEVAEFCEKIDNDEKRQELFDQAKEICELDDFTFPVLERLASLGELLFIEESRTGFDFSLYDEEQRRDYIFQVAVVKYAILVSVLEMMPVNSIVSCFASSSLQATLAAKIAKIYDFKLDGKNFMKLICASTGMSLLFKGIGKGVSKLLPFRFVWKASSAFAAAYAVGIAAKAYAIANGEINADNLREIWENALEDGKNVFKQFQSYVYKNKKRLINELKKRKIVKEIEEA